MMKKFLCVLLFCPLTLSAQTWQKVFQSAQKAVASHPQLTLAASRRSLLLARKNLQTPTPSMQLWLDEHHSPLTPALSNRLNGWAALSNRVMLQERTLRKKQLDFFARQTTLPPEQWQNLFSRADALAERMGEETPYVLVGGKEQDFQSFTVFKKIVTEYRSRFPHKKVIVFLEMLPDKGLRFASPLYTPDKYKRFVQAFAGERINVAGLGDPSVQSAGYLVQENSNLVVSSVEAPASLLARNAHMSRRLKQWRREYPDAVFFVYTSPYAAAYDGRFSLANRLPQDEVFVVSISAVRDTRNFLFHRWSGFKQAHEGVFAWKDKEWARMSGFDAQVLLP